jgi:hypothetical protein
LWILTNWESHDKKMCFKSRKKEVSRFLPNPLASFYVAGTHITDLPFRAVLYLKLLPSSLAGEVPNPLAVGFLTNALSADNHFLMSNHHFIPLDGNHNRLNFRWFHDLTEKFF